MRRIKTYSLRELRKAAGLTLEAVSLKTGIPLPTIQALETGRGKGFSVTMKHTLADFYHVPTQLLFPEIQEQIDLLLGKNRQAQMFIPREEIKRG